MISLRRTARAAHVALAVPALLLAACAGAPEKVVLPKATVFNQTGKALALRYQACGSPADRWSAVPGGAELAAGGTARFDLPAECVHFDAYYADGRLAGSQRSVRREFPFEWVLR